MTPLPPHDPPAAHPAWWVWVLGQATTLALYAGRVKLTGGYPDPVDATADLGVACTQLVLAALLGPALLEGRSRLTRAGTAATVFAALAAGLAGRSPADTARLAVVTAFWLVAIARLIRTPPGRQLAAFLAVGGPVLFYGSLEYAAAPLRLGGLPTLCSPVLGVCTTRLHSALFAPLAAPAAFLFFDFAGRPRRKSGLYRDHDNCDAKNRW